MDVFDVFATFSLLDNITGPLGNIRKGFVQTGVAGGRLSDSFGALTKSMLPFVLAAGVFLASFTPAIGVAANFEASVSSLGAISKASAADMQVMEQAALDLGASTAFTSAQVVQGQTELAKKGFNANQVVAAMPGLLDLAAATQSDLALASTVASGALKSFNMEASQTGVVSDIIAAAATSSATDINGLDAALSNAGATVSKAGGDFADLAAITGKLADVNIDGAVAGTGINIMYSRLQAPVGEAGKALEKLGVVTKDAQGNMLPIFDILESMESALDGMGTADQAAYIQKIFGQEALKSVQSLFGQGISSVRAYADTLRNSGGAAAEMATRQLDNLNGAVTILGSAWEGLQITIGSIFLPVLTPLVRGITGVVNIFNFLAGHPIGKAVLAVATAIAGVVVVAGLFTAAMWGASLAVGALNLSLLANPFVLAGAAIVGVIVLVNELLQDVKGFASLGEMWTEVVNAFNNIGWRTGLQLLWDSLSDGFKGFLGLLATVAISALAIFVSPFAAVAAVIGGLVAGVVAVIAWNFDSISEFFTGLGKSILSGLSAVFDGMKFMFLNFTPLGLIIKHFDDIVNFISSIDLSECGRKLWTTFTDGLKSMISAPVEIFKSGLQKLRNMLPFSDAKEGPLSTLTLSGQRMMETIAGGVGAGAGVLIDAVAGALAAPAKLIDAGIGMLPSIDDIGAGISSGLDAVGEFVFGPAPEPAMAVDALSVPVDLVNRGLDEDPFFGKAPEPAMVGATPVEVSPITSKQDEKTSSRSSRSASKSNGITVNGGLTIHIAEVANLEGLVSELQNAVSQFDG